MDSLLISIALVCICSMMGKEPAGEISLPAARKKGEISFEEALAKRRSVRDYRKEPLSLREVGQLLWAAQGISERKQGLRAAPSAGATYPLEVFLVAGDVSDLPAGIYRYIPAKHALVRISEGDVRAKLSDASFGQPWVKDAPATIAIAAVYSRTAFRYGGRARRYIDMEVGHAGQNIYLQAESLKLGTVAVGAFDDAAVKKALGLKGEEEPLYLMPVGKKL